LVSWSDRQVIRCGPFLKPRRGTAEPAAIELHRWGSSRNVSVKIEALSDALADGLDPVWVDLVDVAALIYSADQRIRRTGREKEIGETWIRHLHFEIAVRVPDVWSRPEVRDRLIRAISFLTEDDYSFEFARAKDPPPTSQYLFSGGGKGGKEIEEVVLFSGGLDSLGGAIRECIVGQRCVALVTHESTTKLRPRRQRLVNLLSERSPHPPLHINVPVNKDSRLTRDTTQRSRSFLYAALAATVAQLLGLSKIRFYENGVVSLNLPLNRQVKGTKASRTTHPRSLALIAELFCVLGKKAMAVENPYLRLTRKEVVDEIVEAGCGELIAETTSCMHTIQMEKERSHCGACSQCLGRRFAILAAGAEVHDPSDSYATDLLVGERGGVSQILVASYVETANQIARLGRYDFYKEYGEAARALSYIDGGPRAAGEMIYDLHQRYAEEIKGVIDRAIGRHARAIFERTLPESCLIRMVCDSRIQSLRFEDTDEENVLRRDGDAWTVRYAGKRSFVLGPRKGIAYLHLLLGSPGKQFRASELIATVDREPEKYLLGGQVDLHADEESIEAYSARLVELKHRRAEAERYDDAEELRCVDKETADLERELSRNLDRRGNLRVETADAKRLRDRVSRAVVRARDMIRTYDPALADHLKSPNLVLGLHPTYRPREDITWGT
jgi:hypothetical protein